MTCFKEIFPCEPFYLFIPYHDELLKIYNQFMSLKFMFKIDSTGIVTARDNLAIDFSEKELSEKIAEFRDLELNDEEIKRKYKLKDTRGWKLKEARRFMENLSDWQNHAKNISYRPFDFRKIYYHSIMIDWRRQNIMQHMLAGENVGLVTSRQCNLSIWNHVLISLNILESSYISNKTGEIGSLFPLYLYNTEQSCKKFDFAEDQHRMENFTTEFRGQLDEWYQHH